MELKSKCLSFFHLNINLLSKNFDNFNHLINKLKLEFDILGISESRILKSQTLNTNVSLQNCVIEQTPTESTAEEAWLYINKIARCTHKHPCMDICTFKDHYLNPLLDNPSKEANKKLFS